ncbi:MAG: UDP-N-acetylmuramate:L-alanyl-gamma-D-glutamyl-meso-diaminopimelate ligase [Thiomonas sp.]|uniref:UDP-N-acetylmuramate:L-alanyl-gamma-D-glutamyl- meso-diaminopimelate ligase n=1 Tax=Thiomonas TaxID=32012 RepID=UPI00238B9360|nr:MULTISPECIES: UDP-N-acetylmuramate:L-alanyl-gamma-D-glutamyl-meso-diaminopimelate ligase [Thiomonas]MDE2268823.1 UDP-N-acetylmuramate:L-alanyl-gamma-D-glutamyl-meso-diaminopimelate ligase [Betaproteobacteria bacterium]HML81306.1 UDP-N-acetylmuramate:L-alanyl-gamma-D-glutamyl-meso-diaminopimelate ligase [Thiomonas arsenitoxydans]
MHIHILGICGTFMGGLAALAKESGHRVTGCDAQVYPPMSTQLQQLGIELVEGYGADQLALRPDLWVIGNVVSRGNALMEAILDAGQPYISGPQWLAEHVLQGRWTLAIAGTHGKTTTTSMLAHILDVAGLKPGFLIGGVPLDFGASARLGGDKTPHPNPPREQGRSDLASSPRGEGESSSSTTWGRLGGGGFFVIEADEYDTAFFDKRSKFVHYRPRTAVLNNLEFDHADIFPDLAAIETQFHHLVRTVPCSGQLVVNARSDALQRVLARGCWSEVVRFDDDENGWSAQGGEQQFEVRLRGKRMGEVRWNQTGAHNRSNALAAIAAAQHAGVFADEACAALCSFQGVKRRMELRGTAGGVQVIDDFAHHPTAIATTIAGLRHRMQADSHAASGRILAVFEPRSNTMKLGAMKALLPGALSGADLSFGYAGGLGWNLAEALQPLGDKAQAFDDLGALVAAVAAAARPGDRVLVMSNGGFGGVHDKLLDALQARDLPPQP